MCLGLMVDVQVEDHPEGSVKESAPWFCDLMLMCKWLIKIPWPLSLGQTLSYHLHGVSTFRCQNYLCYLTMTAFLYVGKYDCSLSLMIFMSHRNMLVVLEEKTHQCVPSTLHNYLLTFEKERRKTLASTTQNVKTLFQGKD